MTEELFEKYAQQLYKLLPPGVCFANNKDSNTNKLLEALAKEFSRIHERAFDLVAEANPLTAAELLDIRYLEAGLPNNCDLNPADTDQGKRLEILSTWTNQGGASKQFFLDLLTSLGVEATIDELYVDAAQLNCVAPCNGSLFDPQMLGYWRVNYVDTSLTDFVAGGSVAGEYLGTFGATNNFECLIRKLKPAHTEVIFNPVTSL